MKKKLNKFMHLEKHKNSRIQQINARASPLINKNE